MKRLLFFSVLLAGCASLDIEDCTSVECMKVKANTEAATKFRKVCDYYFTFERPETVWFRGYQVQPANHYCGAWYRHIIKYGTVMRDSMWKVPPNKRRARRRND